MPCRMHAEYLRQLYLNNALARGEFESGGRRVDLAAIRVPMFVVGTETDHVAPWKSVYKARRLTRSPDYTFLLTSGGHNAGIVSGPTHPRRRHRVRTWPNDSETLTPEKLGAVNAEMRMDEAALEGLLKQLDGNKTLAAQLLGLDRRTLYRKLERWGHPPDPTAT